MLMNMKILLGGSCKGIQVRNVAEFAKRHHQGKEEKSRQYKQCGVYWLLVVADFFDLAQDQEILDGGLDTISSEIFEKILVHKTVFGQVLESSNRSKTRPH